MKKIIFDTDIGSDIDDALALLLALHLRDVDILGVTTVYGPVDLRAKIAYKIITAANRTIPIASGEGEPMYSYMPVWTAGTEGIGALTKEETKAPLESFKIEKDAASFIISQVQTYPNEVTIVALGALTNVAKALMAEPSLEKDIQEVVFMGAGLTYPADPQLPLRKDETYFASPSHNIRCDIKAARELLKTGVPTRAVTNDVTTKLWLEGPGIDHFEHATAPHIQIVGKMLEVWLNYRSNTFHRPITGTCPHDPYTLAVALERTNYESVRGTLSIGEYAETDFYIDDKSPLELVYAEKGSNFIPWLAKHLHQPERERSVY